VEPAIPNSGGDVRRQKIAAAWAVLVGLGCAGGEPERPAGEAEDSVVGEADGVVGEGLASSLNVRVEADTVRFTLSLTNAAAAERVMEYSTAQRTDFAVETPAGEVVWQWSADMGFAQMMSVDTLAAGASRSYEAVWSPGGRTGRHIAVGRLTSLNSPVELRTEFEIPER
jgi:hypothetical protein